MNNNLKVLEISFPSRNDNIKMNKRINSENKIYSKIISNEKSMKNDYSNNLRVSLPYEGIKSIKSINYNKINLNHNSYLSPSSEGEMSFLGNFNNNNSIYYSNSKKEKTNFTL